MRRCDRCDSRGDDDGAATVQSYPLPLELSQHSEECDREPEEEEDDEYEGARCACSPRALLWSPNRLSAAVAHPPPTPTLSALRPCPPCPVPPGVAEASDGYSDVGEPGDTEVVFVKEGVNVWPSRSERIMGRLSLIKQHG